MAANVDWCTKEQFDASATLLSTAARAERRGLSQSMQLIWRHRAERDMGNSTIELSLNLDDSAWKTVRAQVGEQARGAEFETVLEFNAIPGRYEGESSFFSGRVYPDGVRAVACPVAVSFVVPRLGRRSDASPPTEVEEMLQDSLV